VINGFVDDSLNDACQVSTRLCCYRQISCTAEDWRFGVAVTALGVSTLSPDSTGMCDRLRAGIPPLYVA